MQFQKAHVSIVRSIRQVSLVRDWQRSRGNRKLPEMAGFVPNERAGDAADLSIYAIERNGADLACRCESAGARVEQIYGTPMTTRQLHECLDPGMAAAARPIWDACIRTGLPTYSIIPCADRDGCPVTVEQLFLPYAGQEQTVGFMVAALHAFSTEGRFSSHGLLRGIAKVPLHWAVVIDPAIAPPRPAESTGGDLDDGLLDDGAAAPAR